MSKEQLWRGIVCSCYGKKFASASQRIWMDLWCVINGIKSAWLVDYLPLDVTKMRRLLEDSNSAGIFAIQEHSVAILMLNSDVLVVNTAIQLATPPAMFIDVSARLDKPVVVSECVWECVTCAIRAIHGAITDAAKICSGQLLVLPQLTLADSVNLSTVFGWLLGYPVVYWFDTNSSPNNWDHVSLTSLLRYSVIVSSAQSIMKQLQEYNKLPEPIKIDSRSIKFSSSIYVDIADISGSGWTVYTRTYNQVAMEDVTDFECSPDYPPHIILEVKCSEKEVPKFPGCELTIRDSSSNSQVGYYRLPSSSSSRSNSYKEKKTIAMADMQLKVVPLVASKWEYVGYALGFEVEQIDIIKADHKEVEKRCEELFHRWLRGDIGKQPKTWSVLLKALSEIPELTAAKEKLKQELTN